VPAQYQASWASGQTVQFRLLSWKEFRYVTSIDITAAERNLWIYERVRLRGPEIEDVPAGIVAWLGQYLVDQSPFSETVETVKKFRYLALQWFESSYLEQARALIAGTFHIPFDEIEEWDHETFFQRLVAAEMLVGKRMDPVTAEERNAAPAADGRSRKEQQKADYRKEMKDRVEKRRLPSR
jgi:hypothetical protein